jgi:hypothetical protein
MKMTNKVLISFSLFAGTENKRLIARAEIWTISRFQPQNPFEERGAFSSAC